MKWLILCLVALLAIPLSTSVLADVGDTTLVGTEKILDHGLVATGTMTLSGNTLEVQLTDRTVVTSAVQVQEVVTDSIVMAGVQPITASSHLEGFLRADTGVVVDRTTIAVTAVQLQEVVNTDTTTGVLERLSLTTDTEAQVRGSTTLAQVSFCQKAEVAVPGEVTDGMDGMSGTGELSAQASEYLSSYTGLEVFDDRTLTRPLSLSVG